MSNKATQKYFDERMLQLGITDENNIISIHKMDDIYHDEKIFRPNNKGIEIMPFTLDRHKIFYKTAGSEKVVTNERGWNTNEASRWSREYTITRLLDPIAKKDGTVMKYEMPKGVPVVPFFPPSLVKKYEAGTHIETLVLTEGYFKAFKASLHDIDCVGVPSITCLKDKESGELHSEVLKLIKKCTVERIVWLTDGDCRNITSKEIKDGVDLYKRPHQFFKSISSFYDLTSKLDNVMRYFAHINSENIKDEPKGLDDLLVAEPNSIAEIVKELTTFNKKRDTGNFIIKFDISFGVGSVHKYFLLNDVDNFYLHHLQIRPELKDCEFKFNGTLYRYDETENKCVIRIPSSAENYFRVGDDYFEYIEIPDKHNNLTRTYHKRRKETIKDDNGKNIFTYIPKYKAFCNVPDHINYQRVINNCFNTYHPFTYEPEEGECPRTIEFLKHIFSEEELIIDGLAPIKRYEIALDYLTILYKHPQQILPILCLVSEERQTGKTTFLKWLKMIFAENCAIVGNQDFENNFNSHWASKLIIGCDETKIERHIVMERIKGMSTASSIMKEGKGVDQVSMDFFGKFILLSNNERNFATIDKLEIRFWVNKVPVIKSKDVDLLDDLFNEIPAFLNLLSQRKIITQKRERHWFDTRLLRTEALDKIVENSAPSMEKNIRYNLASMFEISENETICIGLDDVVKYVAKCNEDKKGYVKDILHAMGYKSKPFQRKKSMPIISEHLVENKIEYKITTKDVKGRYYEFDRQDFVIDETEDLDTNKLM